nr:MFS transporter [Desulfurispira natronophila]
MHGFFIALGTTIAEPSTILPLIVNYFTANSIIVGLFASLLRGGAVVVQMFAAFYSQSLTRVMPYQRIVYFVRVLSWFGIGAALYFIGDSSAIISLWSLGIGLFIFSFAAGFGSIYYREILGKVFSHRYLGHSTARRQFFAAIGAILSGVVAGWVLSTYSPPQSYGLLFMVSALLLAVGYGIFITVPEPLKTEISERESSFVLFLQNSWLLLRQDWALRWQIIVVLISHSYLFASPFVILRADEVLNLTGWLVGGYVSLQMTGAMLGNILWGQLASRGRNREVMMLSFALMMVAMIFAMTSSIAWQYGVFFLLSGAAMDGFRLVANNLIIIIAPPAKRPVYIALQFNITALGLFFAVPGGIILGYFGYNVLYIFTIIVLFIGLICAQKLSNNRVV